MDVAGNGELSAWLQDRPEGYEPSWNLKASFKNQVKGRHRVIPVSGFYPSGPSNGQISTTPSAIAHGVSATSAIAASMSSASIIMKPATGRSERK